MPKIYPAWTRLDCYSIEGVQNFKFSKPKSDFPLKKYPEILQSKRDEQSFRALFSIAWREGSLKRRYSASPELTFCNNTLFPP